MLEYQFEVDGSRLESVKQQVGHHGEREGGPFAADEQRAHDHQTPEHKSRQGGDRIQQGPRRVEIVLEVQSRRSRPDQQRQVEQLDAGLRQDPLDAVEIMLGKRLGKRYRGARGVEGY